MKKGLLITGIGILLAITALYIRSINKPQNTSQINETSEISQLDTPAPDKTYKGTLPCADCPGIETTLVIKGDNTYTLSSIYQEKNEDEPFEITGTWNIEAGIPDDPNAAYYVLTEDSGNASYYLIENEQTIIQLDQERKRIDSPSDMSLTLQN